MHRLCAIKTVAVAAALSTLVLLGAGHVRADDLQIDSASDLEWARPLPAPVAETFSPASAAPTLSAPATAPELDSAAPVQGEETRSPASDFQPSHPRSANTFEANAPQPAPPQFSASALKLPAQGTAAPVAKPGPPQLITTDIPIRELSPRNVEIQQTAGEQGWPAASAPLSIDATAPGLPATPNVIEPTAARMTPPTESLFMTPQAAPAEPSPSAAFGSQPLPTESAAPIPSATPTPAGFDNVPTPRSYNPPPAPNLLEESRPAPPAISAAKPVPAHVPAQTTAADRVHEVERGQNYWTISRQYYGTARYFAALAEYNRHRISHPDRMKPGMFVLIPESQILDQRYPKMAGIVDAQPKPESLLPSGFFISPQGQPMYRVDEGATLTDIAEKHLGRTARWPQIVGMNQDLLRDGHKLKIGMVLKLPGDASQVAVAPEGGIVR